MKLYLSILLFMMSAFSFGQGKGEGKALKPIIMVMPEKAWCIKHGYGIGPDGMQVDYERALLNEDVLNVITRMGGIMEERGYPLKLLSSTLDDLKNEDALDMALTSKNDAEIQESNLDKLLRVAQADIIVNVAFERRSYGPRNMVEFRVTSVDAATSKQIGGEVGQSSASGTPISNLLEESVLSFIDNFTTSIQRHFQNTIDNGREGTIIFKLATDSPVNFEHDVTLNGDVGELNEVIEYWLGENCVDGSYSPITKTKTRLLYEQVRFPLFGKGKFGGRPKALSADSFIKPIGQLLSQFGLNISVTPIGIGKAFVVVGGK